jgi:hypothetical protein
MTKLRLLRSAVLEELRTNIRRNLTAYRKGGFETLCADPANWFEHQVEYDEAGLAKLRAPTSKSYFEVENCDTLYTAMQGLSPYEARDERLWAYLSHSSLLTHARVRWPVPEDDKDAVQHIAKHFVARDKRGVERDNVGSRLWWMAHLCARVTTIDRQVALRAFLFRSDVRANIVERPTTSQCSELFSALIRRLASSLDGGQKLFERAIFRSLMTEINSVGGYKLLDCLSATHVDAILNDIIGNKLKLTKI